MADCGDTLSLADLQTAKKHQLFEAEVITGKQGGVAGGADIETATNQVTGQEQKTLPAVLRDAGFQPASFDFTTGGTLTATDRNKAVYDPVSMTWYLWKGALPHVIAAGTNPVGDVNWSPYTDPKLRNDLASTADLSTGDALIGVLQPKSWAAPITQHVYNQNRISILDLGGISGVASPSVDSKVVLAIKDNYTIVLPDGFNWVLTGTGSGTVAALMFPQNFVPLPTNIVKVQILCPDGRAKISMSAAGLMFDQNNTDKFSKAHFKNIDFIGADAQNTASRFMYAPEGRTCSNFITDNCSWTGFHTVYWCTMIATKHYNAYYSGCGDTGAIVHTPQWTSGNFAAFNLNEWFQPRFEGKFGALFEIIGGFSNYFHSPWIEKVETVGNQLFLLRQVSDFQFYDMWLENFKSQFLCAFDGDGTEGTQSDLIGWTNGHINNNWSLDASHSGQASGFVALFNRLNPVNTGNAYDTKFSFSGIFEHPSSVQGWALTRTGSTLNLATSIHIFDNMRLRPGQPNASDGMVLGGGTPDLRRNFRDLSSNKFDLLPGNFQIISGRNTAGSQKDLVFDNQGDTAYFRRNGAKVLEWSSTYLAPGSANTIQCGVTSRPWSGGFTQTAFTVTSDERHKTKIAAVTDENKEMSALLDAWGEVEFSIYQYVDRIEVKGDKSARWHFGVVAQRVVESLTKHGLDWRKYAFICHDEWGDAPAVYDDVTGELMHEEIHAGDKFGIRYEEALVVEAAYVRRELERLKSK